MNERIIKVRCPWCSKVLRIKEPETTVGKSITCPVCKQKNPLASFARVEEAHSSSTDGKTQLLTPGNNRIGILRHLPYGHEYPLKCGRNVIGRKSETSKADIQLPLDDNLYISREHIVIDVVYNPLSGYQHLISLYKEKVNDTYLGKEKLTPGDQLILSDGLVITLPNDTQLRFEIPDGDKTQMYI